RLQRHGGTQRHAPGRRPCRGYRGADARALWDSAPENRGSREPIEHPLHRSARLDELTFATTIMDSTLVARHNRHVLSRNLAAQVLQEAASPDGNSLRALFPS